MAKRPNNKHVIAECKWSPISLREENQLLEKLKEKFDQSKLKSKIKHAKFKILSIKSLAQLVQLDHTPRAPLKT